MFEVKQGLEIYFKEFSQRKSLKVALKNLKNFEYKVE